MPKFTSGAALPGVFHISALKLLGPFGVLGPFWVLEPFELLGSFGILGPSGVLGPFEIIIPTKYFPAIRKIDSHFENARQTDDDKNPRIIGLRNLAKASAAQKW